jgi:outer membrane lipoprotein SlyB
MFVKLALCVVLMLNDKQCRRQFMRMTLKTMLSMIFVSGLLSGCVSQQQLGTAVGGTVGGVLGHQLGDSTAATIGGTLMGSWIGSQIGRSMDVTDQQQLQKTFEHQKTNDNNTWVNPETQSRFTAQPTYTFYQNNRQGMKEPCRSLLLTHVDRQHRTQVTRVDACRSSNGYWYLIKEPESLGYPS